MLLANRIMKYKTVQDTTLTISQEEAKRIYSEHGTLKDTANFLGTTISKLRYTLDGKRTRPILSMDWA